LLELMDDTTTLGTYLRAERERRDLSLRTISESTKVSLPLLEGLESDDISRWPGGIFRRAFVRSYAEAVGLNPDDVYRRFERQYKPAVGLRAGRATSALRRTWPSRWFWPLAAQPPGHACYGLFFSSPPTTLAVSF
jgi:cytoskeletal protein RodZ